MPRPPPRAVPPPTEARLHEAALSYLARFAATEAGVVRVLDRRIERWARGCEDRETVAATVPVARAAARVIAARLVASGAIDDAGFAAGRAASLARAGRSRRAVGAHLAARGVAGEIARAVVSDDPEAELAAALIFARKRRFGPFGGEMADPKQRSRVLASFARAGFSGAIAGRVMRMDRDQAEGRIAAFRAG